MATYTPNWNLSKPENTDQQSTFISDYCGNMDIIDQHLGSGGGGNVAVLGAFIDTNRILASGTYSNSNPLVYTATEDCFADVAFLSADGDKNVYANIDGVRVDRLFNNSGIVVSNEIYPLRKGQTLRVETSRTDNDSAYTIYGIIQGTNGIFAPIIYSDTEREVGTWRDNKPLYQKTIKTGYLPNNSSMYISTPADIENIVNYWGFIYNPNAPSNQRPLPFSSGGTNDIRVDLDGGTISITDYANWSSYDGYLTIQYTKTTDTAGSGNWNVDGVPTVHYDTNEQVIGTWLGKPLYQRTWDFISTNIINANTWTNLFSNDIDIDKVTMNETLDDEGRSNKVAYCGVRNGYIAVYSTYATNIQTITLRYTKTTD